MLNYLQGTPEELGASKKRKKKKEEKKKRKEEKRKEGKGKVRKKVAKFALAPTRAAFLTAVNVNALKLAKRLKQAYQKNPARLEAFWTKLGGKMDALKSAIEKGTNSKLNGSDVGAVAAGTVLLAAAPVVVAVVKLFQELKSDQSGDSSGDAASLEEMRTTLQNDPNTQTGTATMDADADAGLVKGDGEGMSTTTMLMIGGAAAAGLYLASRK